MNPSRLFALYTVLAVEARLSADVPGYARVDDREFTPLHPSHQAGHLPNARKTLIARQWVSSGRCVDVRRPTYASA